MNIGQTMCSVFLLSVFLLPRISYDFHWVHSEDHHHEDSCEIEVQTECHLAVYHDESLIECEHDIHLTEVKEECEWCDMARPMTLDCQFFNLETGSLVLSGNEPKESDKSILLPKIGTHRLKRGPPMV